LMVVHDREVWVRHCQGWWACVGGGFGDGVLVGVFGLGAASDGGESCDRVLWCFGAASLWGRLWGFGGVASALIRV